MSRGSKVLRARKWAVRLQVACTTGERPGIYLEAEAGKLEIAADMEGLYHDFLVSVYLDNEIQLIPPTFARIPLLG